MWLLDRFPGDRLFNLIQQFLDIREKVDVHHFLEGKLICLLIDGVLGLSFEERESIYVLTGGSTSSTGDNTSSTGGNTSRLCGAAGKGSGCGIFRFGLQLLGPDPQKLPNHDVAFLNAPDLWIIWITTQAHAGLDAVHDLRPARI